ncbi:unnamed protein product [Caenorhabditis angaria]|uniref:Uncharacterized protein n=1 Tax=Caenorhabditis angaria TaxID=860376 RepID=A0A9P1IY39_9PELO|nr:unnamed protein product [Caenorhabditis angaria]
MENIQEELDMIDVYLVEIMRLFPKSTEEKLMSRYDILGMAQKILTTIYNDSTEQDNNHKLVKLMVEEGKETLVFVNFEHKIERIFEQLEQEYSTMNASHYYGNQPDVIIDGIFDLEEMICYDDDPTQDEHDFSDYETIEEYGSENDEVELMEFGEISIDSEESGNESDEEIVWETFQETLRTDFGWKPHQQ